MRRLFEVACVVGIFSLVQSTPVPGKKEYAETPCGYESCNPTKEGYVNIHLIPHSHDDVGWLKTVEQYYYGTKQEVQRAAVTLIYDNTLKSVLKHPDRRFIYVETAFFWKWWQQQEEQEKEQLRELVNAGRIEFIGGGWSMNDEAVCHYQSIIDNMAWGLKKLNDTFGECARPKIGWQIDPFGHSSGMASIFASLGYDAVLLGRIDYEDLETRKNNKSMEMVWRGSNSLGRPSDIFTSVLYNSYSTPGGYCYDVNCNDPIIVDDPDSPENNVQWRGEDFITYYVQDVVTKYQTQNLIIPMGSDFTYLEAENWFKNMDKLIKYINDREDFNGVKYNIFYSTPSCYVAAVNKESNGIIESPLKTDDFFPYGIDQHSYWTGYFTSRSSLKRFERIGNNFLQICKQLYTITNISSENEPKLDTLREAMGVLQHHDAVTGTEKEIIAYDYARLLNIGIKNCENIANQALSSLTNVETGNFETCLLANVSQCAFTETNDVFVVTIYNPLSRPVSKYVRFPVSGSNYIITGPDGSETPSQIIPIAQGVRNIQGRQSDATIDLIFEATNIPPLGYKSYYVQKTSGDRVTKESAVKASHYSYAAQGVGIDIDLATGLLAKVVIDGYSLDVDQRYWYYNGSNNIDDYRPSGAYIFRPDPDQPIQQVPHPTQYGVYAGDLVTEVHQAFNDFVSQTLRIYSNEKFVECDWVVGPLDLNDETNGKEVISRFSTTLKSGSTFYTDSNGKELLQRIRNYRPTWDFNGNESESSNYYPITSRIVIEDVEADLRFAVVTDRSQGGSSLEDGAVELMILRNTVEDDSLGVGEPLQEAAFDKPIVVRGSHYITFGPIADATSGQSTASIQKDIAERKILDSWIFLTTPSESSFDDYKAQHPMEFSGLTDSLPQNVHILTLEPWGGNSFLLRLEHTFEKNEDSQLSEAVDVDLTNLFTTFEVTSLRETTLGGNQWLEDNQRLNFTSAYQSDGAYQEDFVNKELLEDSIVTLKPMQIRTFVIEVSAKTNKLAK